MINFNKFWGYFNFGVGIICLVRMPVPPVTDWFRLAVGLACLLLGAATLAKED